MRRVWARSASGEGFRQADELSDFPDFFLEGLSRELLPHFKFHNTPSHSDQSAPPDSSDSEQAGRQGKVGRALRCPPPCQNQRPSNDLSAIARATAEASRSAPLEDRPGYFQNTLQVLTVKRILRAMPAQAAAYPGKANRKFNFQGLTLQMH